ncbi:hypothetical protein A2U01_0056570, partial [Trifolium medium]|nr:hypothetical protein [Trifolium medium]
MVKLTKLPKIPMVVEGKIFKRAEGITRVEEMKVNFVRHKVSLDPRRRMKPG